MKNCAYNYLFDFFLKKLLIPDFSTKNTKKIGTKSFSTKKFPPMHLFTFFFKLFVSDFSAKNT